MLEKPFSDACERNRHPILDVLRSAFADRRRVLEIGSGTGQHAVHFAQHLPHVHWQCSDRPEYLQGIGAWLDEAALPNTPVPWSFDVNDEHWPAHRFDAIYSANTLHIMAWTEVERLFAGLTKLLEASATLVVYGPFRRAGLHTSVSNGEFDAALRERAPHMGIRDLEAVDALAAAVGLRLIADVQMPANNLCLVWRRG